MARPVVVRAVLSSIKMAAASTQSVVLITGASRGIGLGLAETYAKKGWRVLATARDAAKATELQALAKANKSVSILTLDVSDTKSVAALPAAVTAAGVTAIDVLLNNAGVNIGDSKMTSAMTFLETETVDNWINIYRTNVVGVWDVTRVLLSFVRAANLKSKGGARIVNISSIMGSVVSTLEGPWPGYAAAYRASKTALNELSAVQSREYNNAALTAAAGSDAKAKADAAPILTVIALHPGWVETDLGKSGGSKPPTTIAQSVTGIEKVVSESKSNAKTVFPDFEGNTLPW